MTIEAQHTQPQNEAVYVERHLQAVSPELQEQLAIALKSLDGWMAFKVHTVLVQQIYRGESLDVDLSEMRDTVVIPEYTRQHRIYMDEASDVHARQIPALKLRMMQAENDIRSAAERMDATTLNSRSDDLETLKRDVERKETNALIKEMTAASIRTLLTAPYEDEFGVRLDMLTREGKKSALREVSQILIAQINTLERAPSLSRDERIELADTYRKLETLRAELSALEAVDTHTKLNEDFGDMLAQATVEAPEQHEAPRRQSQAGVLGSVALAFRVALSK